VEYFGWTGRIFHCSSRDHLRKLLVRFEDSTKKNIGTTDKARGNVLHVVRGRASSNH